jgi:hypothetical protein
MGPNGGEDLVVPFAVRNGDELVDGRDHGPVDPGAVHGAEELVESRPLAEPHTQVAVAVDDGQRFRFRLI